MHGCRIRLGHALPGAVAVAAAISLFGLGSGAALATVVGVLVEVPVMFSVVRLATATRSWYETPHRAG